MGVYPIFRQTHIGSIEPFWLASGWLKSASTSCQVARNSSKLIPSPGKSQESVTFHNKLLLRRFPLYTANSLSLTVYERIPLIWGVGGTWGVLQRCVQIILETTMLQEHDFLFSQCCSSACAQKCFDHPFGFV